MLCFRMVLSGDLQTFVYRKEKKPSTFNKNLRSCLRVINEAYDRIYIQRLYKIKNI